jgi:hypothetical protein
LFEVSWDRIILKNQQRIDWLKILFCRSRFWTQSSVMRFMVHVVTCVPS